ncbi:MAG: cell division protein ZapA [Muribaculaceae bacterium]|nr:cell division protein ZapA [Muribaculaceae bacterium]
MNADKEHRITIKIADIESFKLPVSESEESFYRMVVQKINDNMDRLRYGINGDSTEVALAKVAVYYATMLYRRTNQMNSQAGMLHDFEARLDSLLESME